MKDATNGSAGSRDEVGGTAGLPQLPFDEHADVAGESRGILEVVRHEQRRDLEPGEELLQLGPHVDLGVRVERRERLVEQQDLGVAGERAGERDALALAAREVAGPCVLEVPDPEAVEVLVGGVAPRVLDVLADGQVREERVVLEDEPDAALAPAAGRRRARRRTRSPRRSESSPRRARRGRRSR